MQPRLLDLASLREGRLPRAHGAEPTLAEFAAAAVETPISRRQLLGMAGVAAAAATPLTRALDARLLGALEYSIGRQRAVFRLGGRDRWVVDTRWFAGAPKLTCERSATGLRLELSGARYPGTTMPADFVCELTRGLGGWRMRLTLPRGDFSAQVPFERWLSGQAPARATVRLKSRLCDLGGASHLDLSGHAEAEFTPAWQLRLGGRDAASISGLGAPLRADEVTLSLLPAEAPSLLRTSASAPVPPLRSLVELRRGSHHWALEGAAATPPGTFLHAPGEAFDLLRVEAAEAPGGRLRHGLVALATTDDPRFFFSPGEAFQDALGRPLTVPLRDARYAVAFSRSGHESALVAGLGSEPSWVHTSEMAFQIGSAPGQVDLQVLGRNGQARDALCQPSLLGMSVPLAGAVTLPAQAGSRARIHMVADAIRRGGTTATPRVVKPVEEEPVPAAGAGATTTATPRPVTDGDRELQVQPGAGAARPGVRVRDDLQVQPGAGRVIARPDRVVGQIGLSGFTVSALRPDDLLALTFGFDNLTVKVESGKGPALVKADEAKPAHLVVTFPPQHVGEQAFLETAPELASSPPGRAPGSQGGETPVRPAGAVLSGPSRLVFRVPGSVKSIPYTLEGLLDWSQLEPSLSPNALPPPDPPRTAAAVAATGRAQRATPEVAAGLTAAARTLTQGKPLSARLSTTNPQARAGAVTPQVRAYKRDPADVVTVMPQARLKSDAPMVAAVSPAAAAAIAAAVAPQRPVPLEDLHTAIEAPYRLFMSPNRTAGWAHALQAVTHDGRTELWHTRLGVRLSDGHVMDRNYEYAVQDGRARVVKVSTNLDPSGYWRTLRAIWSLDYKDQLFTRPNVQEPFRMSLDKKDRSDLVWLTADFKTIPDCNERVVNAKRLMLSSLGAWMDTRYAYPKPVGIDISLEEWRHLAAMGRDQYVRVVYKGHLFPFGHAVSLVKVTERKFHDEPNQGSVAYLRQRFFIVVRQPVKTYPAFWQLDDARDFPFRKVRITSLITPSLDDPVTCKAGNISAAGQDAFWPKVGGKEFEFHAVGEDWAGNSIEFTLPMMFIDATIAYHTDAMARAVNHYNGAAVPLRERDLAGQEVALADPTGGKDGSTSFKLAAMRFCSVAPEQSAAILNSVQPPARPAVETFLATGFELQDQPQFYPSMEQSLARVPAISQVTGQDVPVRVALDPAYVGNSWDPTANAGQVFLGLVDAANEAAKQGLGFPTDRSGGLAAPDMSITGLSRKLGPVGGALGDLATGAFDPASFFGDMAPTLFGCLDIIDIVAKGLGLSQSPNLTVERLPAENALLAKYVWAPKVPKEDTFIFLTHNGAATFTMTAQVKTPLVPGPSAPAPSFSSDVVITDFGLSLLDIIIVTFDRVSFSARNGAPPSADVQLANVEFAGALSFVNELRKVLSSGDLGGLSIDITAKGLKAGFAITLPTIACGVMSIQNIKLSAGLELFFMNDPLKIRFGFSEKADPFTITVSIFGGGGFFAIELDPDGLSMLEASFEFGGNFSLDIGVASGGAYLMAGFYLKYTKAEDNLSLTGYVRCGGHLSVLGIITISAEFYLGLTYETAGNRLWGEARLTVEIEILFFSFSVELRVERQFAGDSKSARWLDEGVRVAAAGAPPTRAVAKPQASRMTGPYTRRTQISDFMDQASWTAYCGAFE